MLNSQQFSGLVPVRPRAYGPMNDISNLQASVRDDIYGDLRSFTMWPIGSRFRPDFAISRLDLATALVLGSRVPQYVADQAVYRDVADSGSRSFVESCQVHLLERCLSIQVQVGRSDLTMRQRDWLRR